MKKWTFAKVEDFPVAFLPTIPSPGSLYRDSLRSKEGQEKILNDALNAALENLMSWERVAKAWGFDVEVFTDTGCGNCGARGPMTNADGFFYLTPEDAAEAWNLGRARDE